MKQLTDKSIYLWVLKWLPVIGTALIASHYAMLFLGYKSFIIDYITDVSLFAWVYLYFASKLFFCKLHRAFCIYIGVASLDIDLHNWFDLDFLEPQWLIPLIMSTTAVVLITLAWRKKNTMLWIDRECLPTSSGRQQMLSTRAHAYSPTPRHR